ACGCDTSRTFREKKRGARAPRSDSAVGELTQMKLTEPRSISDSCRRTGGVRRGTRHLHQENLEGEPPLGLVVRLALEANDPPVDGEIGRTRLLGGFDLAQPRELVRGEVAVADQSHGDPGAGQARDLLPNHLRRS